MTRMKLSGANNATTIQIPKEKNNGRSRRRGRGRWMQGEVDARSLLVGASSTRSAETDGNHSRSQKVGRSRKAVLL